MTPESALKKVIPVQSLTHVRYEYYDWNLLQIRFGQASTTKDQLSVAIALSEYWFIFTQKDKGLI